MKPIHALAILGVLAAGPALAQQAQTVQAVQADFLAQIQQELQQDGYYRGPVDGVFGDQTRSALAAWQRDQGLQPTGQLNAQTLAALDVDQMATQQAEVPEGQVRTQRGTVTERDVESRSLTDQEARRPGETSGSDVETLRDEGMSSPNIENEIVPERPGTGTPAPGARPEALERPQRD